MASQNEVFLSQKPYEQRILQGLEKLIEMASQIII